MRTHISEQVFLDFGFKFFQVEQKQKKIAREKKKIVGCETALVRKSKQCQVITNVLATHFGKQSSVAPSKNKAIWLCIPCVFWQR